MRIAPAALCLLIMQSACTPTVSSEGQSGGVTAGTIDKVIVTNTFNAERPPRVIDDPLRKMLLDNLPIGKPVQVEALANDKEAFDFAVIINAFLDAHGYKTVTPILSFLWSSEPRLGIVVIPATPDKSPTSVINVGHNG